MTRILVIDDDDLLRTAIAEALVNEGYAVDAVENGESALELVRRQAPDAIVLDLKMPVMDGWAFLETFRQEPVGQTVPVLVLSASRDLSGVLEAGASACMRKPFDLGALIEALASLIASRSLRHGNGLGAK